MELRRTAEAGLGGDCCQGQSRPVANASLDAVERIAERFGPIDTAVLFSGAPRIASLFDGKPLVLDSAQAAEATRILRARRVVPVHYEGWAHCTEGHDQLVAAFAAAGLADRLEWT